MAMVDTDIPIYLLSVLPPTYPVPTALPLFSWFLVGKLFSPYHRSLFSPVMVNLYSYLFLPPILLISVSFHRRRFSVFYHFTLDSLTFFYPFSIPYLSGAFLFYSATEQPALSFVISSSVYSCSFSSFLFLLRLFFSFCHFIFFLFFCIHSSPLLLFFFFIFLRLLFFLDAPSHLYKRVCPSVRPSVRP